MPRYKLTIEYDGTHYCGWQKQDDRRSVQDALNAATLKFCGIETEIVGAGRTDSGVHASAQVAHVDFDRDYEPFQVMQGINFYLFNPSKVPLSNSPPLRRRENKESPLPEGGRVREGVFCENEEAENKNRIAILSAERVTDDFHARFSATKRRYLYRIINRRSRLGLEAGRAWHVIEPLNETLMQEAANLLLGHHDFTSFRDAQCQAKSPMKTLEQLDITRIGDELRIATSARSFLHHQVRIMTGTLAMVGKGRLQIDGVRKALEARNRAKAGITAPPDGLYLVGVEY